MTVESRAASGWPATFDSVHDEASQSLRPTNFSDHEQVNLWWSPAFVESEEQTIASLVELYTAGRLDEIVIPLRLVNPAIEKVEVVGTHIFVRLRGHSLPLPYGVLGDGARRILEFATALTGTAPLILIDELENGFHHTTLPVVLDLLRTAPPDRQIFATTHREELIRVACESFINANDDGLRIIRLDRNEEGHNAVVHTAEEALAGMEAGLEIRG